MIFLQEALGVLEVTGRATAVVGRAEALARTSLRGSASFVTARSFGAPPVTAECGAGFLAPGGLFAVADPPGAPAARWPADGLAALGLARAGAVDQPASVTLLERVGDLPAHYPRRVGVPGKRPLWTVAPAGPAGRGTTAP